MFVCDYRPPSFLLHTRVHFKVCDASWFYNRILRNVFPFFTISQNFSASRIIIRHRSSKWPLFFHAYDPIYNIDFSCQPYILRCRDGWCDDDDDDRRGRKKAQKKIKGKGDLDLLICRPTMEWKRKRNCEAKVTNVNHMSIGSSIQYYAFDQLAVDRHCL